MRHLSLGPARRALLLALPLLLAAAALTARAQTAAEARACVLILLHDQGAPPASLAGLARKLQSTCAVRTPAMPWGQQDIDAKEAAAVWQALAKQVRELRRQGARRVLVGGQGMGANAAMAYAGAVGETDGVVILAPLAQAGGMGELPRLAAGLPQHSPALWVMGSADPLAARGEAFAYAKAPPHPGSRYDTVKADRKGTADAAAKAVLEWLKANE